MDEKFRFNMIKRPQPRLCLGKCHLYPLTASISALSNQEKRFVLSEQRNILERVSSEEAQVRVIDVFGAGDIFHDTYDTHQGDV